MKSAGYFTSFIILNFGALGLGILLMNNGPMDSWYQNLNKAPWTPPNWVFGTAWSIIMICFSVYMTALVKHTISSRIWKLYFLQLGFNIIWNFIFFNQHHVLLGAINLVVLLIIISMILFQNKQILGYKSILIAPYFLWLLVANSLNFYILFKN